MRTTSLLGTSFFLALAGLAACSSTPSPETTPTTPDASVVETPFTVAPSTANVATCRKQTLVATPADGVTWSVEGGGSIADGLYSAPIAVPSPATATVKATRGQRSATATLTLATAFPGAPKALARTSGTSQADFVHGVAANGARVYALTGGGIGSVFGVSKSTDGGLTWTSAATLATGDGYASSIAVDPANPELVYVAIHRGDKSADGLLELAVSKDGGTTFATTGLFDGGNGDAARPDVTAPSPNHVVVSAQSPWQNDGNGEQGAQVVLFHSADSGATWGSLPTYDNGYHSTSVAATLVTPRTNGMLVESGTGRYGTQLATNGAGKACVTYAEYDINDTRGETHWVVCSTDGGAKWGTPVAAATGRPRDIARPQLAISKDGRLVVLSYDTFADGTVDEIGKTAFRVSLDGGATFGAEKRHADVPDPGAEGAKLAVRNAEVLVDDAGVVWFVRQIGNGVRLQLDKSCDAGATLSGAIDLPSTTPVYYPALFQSSAGLFASGIYVTGAESGPGVVHVLAP